MNFWSGNESADHGHTYIADGSGTEYTSGATASHQHAVTGSTEGQTVPHAHNFSAATGTPSAGGTIAGAGITGHILNDIAKVNITDAITIGFSTDNSTWTTKAKANFASIANINTATGTDELDITTLVTVNSFNYIKLAEPTAKKGGKLIYHIQIIG
jgi:hypothetical protein